MTINDLMIINIDKNCNINHRDFNRNTNVMTTKNKMITNIDTTFSINKDINRNSSKVMIINNKMTTPIDNTFSYNRNIYMVMIIMLRNRVKIPSPDSPLTLPLVRSPNIPGRLKIINILEADQPWGFLPTLDLSPAGLNTPLHQSQFMVSQESKIRNSFAS